MRAIFPNGQHYFDEVRPRGIFNELSCILLLVTIVPDPFWGILVRYRDIRAVLGELLTNVLRYSN